MSFTERTRRVVLFRAAAVALAMVGAMAIAGCGGDDSSTHSAGEVGLFAPDVLPRGARRDRVGGLRTS